MRLSAALGACVYTSFAFAAPVVSVVDSTSGRAAIPAIIPPLARSVPHLKLPFHIPVRVRSPDSDSGLAGSHIGAGINAFGERLPAHAPKSPFALHKPDLPLSMPHAPLEDEDPISNPWPSLENMVASSGNGEAMITLEPDALPEGHSRIPCLHYISSLQLHHVNRQHADLVVLSILLTFILVLLLLEIWSPMYQRLRHLRSGHGPIYLEDEKDVSDDAWHLPVRSQPSFVESTGTRKGQTGGYSMEFI
ncbi:hypothetical protein F4780DRAFT_744358 [Xylariomycetidae sp. FL0641]|nr:hypothetical protein F4780DRAFT_744358 [Xylariomycetidae sp. FL0641]